MNMQERTILEIKRHNMFFMGDEVFEDPNNAMGFYVVKLFHRPNFDNGPISPNVVVMINVDSTRAAAAQSQLKQIIEWVESSEERIEKSNGNADVTVFISASTDRATAVRILEKLAEWIDTTGAPWGLRDANGDISEECCQLAESTWQRLSWMTDDPSLNVAAE